jgi:FlaA1/EpsC-like NDP-sugar epimerase
LRRLLLSNRGVRVLVAHSALIVLANYLAFWLRFDGTIPDGYWALWLDTIPWLVVLRGLTFVPFHIYEGVWRYVGIRDLRAILGGVFSSTVVFYVLIHGLLGLSNYPRSVFLVDSVFLVFLVGGIRVGWRFYREYQPGGKGTRVLIFGAGDAGQAIAREIHAGGQHGYLPVGFVDDDRAKAGQRIHGVPVLGTRNDLPRIIAEARPSEVLVAIPRATPGVLRAVVKALEPYKLPIKALPHLRDILDGRVTLNDVRRLEVADLLGRAPVGLDPQNVSHLVEVKRVLVTGAGGSIGSELSRQVAALRPSSLVLLERYENALWALERSLAGAQAGVDVYPIIGDVTDEGRIDEVLRERRPQVILHAAAHKHVPLMELNPCEAIKNNVKGTRIVGEAAVRHGVDRFVLISTDKAVNPSSVMGATKCVAELLTMRLAERASTCFMVVRFGNVMGSNGSVIPLFLEQIKNGGPVTITHPDMRRYFMLIPEAVQLVLQAAALGDNGAAYVLDMGDEIRVLDIARNLIRLSGFIPEREIPITFIGPRPGEKLSEELVASGETVEPSGIQGIRRVRASANPTCATLEQDVAELERLAELGGAGSVIQQLCALVPTFRPSVERDLDMAPSQPALPASPTGAAATLIGEIRGFA